MDRTDLGVILRQTLDDLRLSRSERRALGEVLADLSLSTRDAAVLRSLAFDLAREALARHDDRLVLDWLEDVLKTVDLATTMRPEGHAEALFMPGDDGPARIVDLIASAKRSVDVCVFTITDDRISRALLDAHRRGVRVRIVTDHEKTLDRGSDVAWLERAGVSVRTEMSLVHMHHKFAVFDGGVLLTGSYNWTRGAAEDNLENFVVTDDARLVQAFARTFGDLWRQLA
jgi:phosphatidylserine/phosphatidylglycerophosphate/cardiolipin synthase-like enzyme